MNTQPDARPGIRAWMLGTARSLAQRAARAVRGRSMPSRTEWEHLQNILLRALELHGAEREAWLREACRNHAALRREVESLLAASEREGPVDRLEAVTQRALLGQDSGRPRDVGPYVIGPRLGSGGMGVVYTARDTRLDRAVALKFLPPHVSADAAAKQRFLTEARAAASLDHPNVCTIHEVGETATGELFIAMPHYEGETLRSRLARGPLPIADAIPIAMQVARGLAKAHERGIVHRDIKPANLIVTIDGVAKILDFGIAKLGDTASVLSTARPGTLAYMSPEQVDGLDVDHRADIWALGVVLFEMVAGVLPFRNPDSASLRRAICSQPAPALSAERTVVPKELNRIVQRALAKRREDRYSDVRELAGDLEECAASIERDLSAGSRRPDADEPGNGTTLAAEGERRVATVLVSTVADYFSLVDQLPAADVEFLADELRGAFRGIVEAHGGVIQNATAEEISAVFGVGVSHEDDFVRAVRAAFEVHRFTRDSIAGPDAQPVRLQSGIDTGVVLARADTTGQTRVTGAPIRVATWLAAHAAADEILVSPQNQHLIAPYYETEPLAPIAWRGSEQRLTPHRILRRSRFETRLEAAEQSSLSRYTGRESEMRQLQTALRHAAQGDGRAISVVANAGMGKSRLIYEFRRLTRADETEVVLGRCSTHATAPYFAFIDVVRQLLCLQDSAEADSAHGAADRVRKISEELVDFIPLYLHLLSLQSTAYPIPNHLRGDHLRVAMSEAIATLLTLSAAHKPLVLLLEDWQWADEASCDALAQVVALAAAHPLLVVVSYRPDVRPAWCSHRHHTTIRLDALAPAASLAIMTSVLRTASVPEHVARFIHQGTGGNPFFIEEVCRALREQRRLEVRQGRVTVSRPLEMLELPETVHIVIRSRLDRLDSDSREVLRIASVIGREFRRNILDHAVAGAHDVERALERLCDADLIRLAGGGREPTYRFKHALTQEVTFDSLLEHHCRQVHRRVGAALETLEMDRRDENLERLCYHFAAAEDWARAVHYGRQAAEKANLLSRFSDADDILRRTQEWLLKLPPDSTRTQTLIDVLLRRERLCETLGHRAVQQEMIEKLIGLLEPGGETPALAEVYLRQGDLNTLLRRFETAEHALNRSLDMSRRVGDRRAERMALSSIGLLRWYQGRSSEAIIVLDQAIAIDRERGETEALATDLINRSAALVHMDERAAARTALEEALAIGEQSANPVRLMYVLPWLASIYRESGDIDGAMQLLQRARSMAEQRRLSVTLAFHLTSIASLHLQRGEIEESLRLYVRAVAVSRRSGYAEGLAASTRMLGDVLYGLSRYAEALPHLQEAATAYTRLDSSGDAAHVIRHVASAHEQLGEYEQALQAWRELCSLCQRADLATVELSALEGIARVLRRLDRDPDELLAAAADAYAAAELQSNRPVAGAMRNLMGIVEFERDHPDAALAHYQAGYEIFREAGDRVHAGMMLNCIAATELRLGRAEDALQHLDLALSHHRSTGRRLLEAHACATIGEAHLQRGAWSEAEQSFDTALGIRRELDDPLGQAWMLHALARTAAAAGRLETAATWCGQAADIAQKCGDAALLTACAGVANLQFA